jgi:hypothetical protein
MIASPKRSTAQFLGPHLDKSGVIAVEHPVGREHFSAKPPVLPSVMEQPGPKSYLA